MLSDDEIHNYGIEVLRLLKGIEVKEGVAILKRTIRDLKKIGMASTMNLDNNSLDLLLKKIPN